MPRMRSEALEFYDGRDGWSNGDSLYADPRGRLWMADRAGGERPTLRKLDDQAMTRSDVPLRGWRYLTMILGQWRGYCLLSDDGPYLQAPMSEQETWTDISLPDSDGAGPESLFGISLSLGDEPEFLEHWEKEFAPEWARLRSAEWISSWAEPA